MSSEPTKTVILPGETPPRETPSRETPPDALRATEPDLRPSPTGTTPTGTSPLTTATTASPPALASLCDEVFFCITATQRLSPADLQELFERRAGMPHTTMESWEPWVLGLCAAIAPIAPPHWMPMARAVEAGLSLEGGARGLRALFTSEPSARDVERVRTLGALVVRALGAVSGADGRVEAEEELHRRALIASLGLPAGDQALLLAEPPLPAESLHMPERVDAKIAAAIVRGGFYAAMSNGIDPREEQAVRTLAVRLGLTEDETATLRAEAHAVVEAAEPFGNACMEAIRYMLEGEPQAQRLLGAAALSLALPAVHRTEGAKALAVGYPVILGHKYRLDDTRRDAVLALAWVAALRTNPSYTRRLELVARHARLAADHGDPAHGRPARTTVQDHLDAVLYPLFSAAIP